MERKIIYKEWIDEIIGLVKKERESSVTSNVDYYRLALAKVEEINKIIYGVNKCDFSIVNIASMALFHNKGKQEVYRMVEILGFLVISKKEAKAVRNGREIL